MERLTARFREIIARFDQMKTYCDIDSGLHSVFETGPIIDLLRGSYQLVRNTNWIPEICRNAIFEINRGIIRTRANDLINGVDANFRALTIIRILYC